MRNKTTINGVEMPEEYSGTGVVNNVVFSRDGKKYAVIRSGKLEEHDMPANGKVTVDGMQIQYRNGSVSMKGSGISMGNINIGGMNIRSNVRGGTTTINMGGSSLEHTIDKIGAVTPGDKICLTTKNNSIDLDLRDDNQLRIKGDTDKLPTYENGVVQIFDFNGTLWLPQQESNLELALETKNGTISGEIAHKGYVETKNGSINLNVYAPLEIHTSTKNGTINVKGMVETSRGVYMPRNEKPIGILRTITKNGTIKINYRA